MLGVLADDAQQLSVAVEVLDVEAEGFSAAQPRGGDQPDQGAHGRGERLGTQVRGPVHELHGLLGRVEVGDGAGDRADDDPVRDERGRGGVHAVDVGGQAPDDMQAFCVPATSGGRGGVRERQGIGHADGGHSPGLGYLDAEAIDATVIPAGWWQPLVFPTDRPPGTVDRAAYVFCALEQFHQRLGRRDIFAVASSRWADPRSRLLTAPAWDRARRPVLNALGLPDEPAEILASHTRQLDAAWRHVAATVGTKTAVIIDDDGRLHAEKLDAVPDPASLTELRRQCEAMIPHVEIGEAILDVMSWLPAFGAAFTSASGGETRLNDLPVTIATALTAHALNIGFTPVIARP